MARRARSQGGGFVGKPLEALGRRHADPGKALRPDYAARMVAAALARGADR